MSLPEWLTVVPSSKVPHVPGHCQGQDYFIAIWLSSLLAPDTWASLLKDWHRPESSLQSVDLSGDREQLLAILI